jgi:hypothetical protein
MKEATVTLRSKNPDFFNSGRCSAKFVPVKDYKGQAVEVEEGYFYCDVPTKVTYEDDFKKTKVLFENYAQFLIDAYGMEVVVVKEKEIVDAPIVKSRKVKPPVEKPPEVEAPVIETMEVIPKKKGKKDETLT